MNRHWHKIVVSGDMILAFDAFYGPLGDRSRLGLLWYQGNAIELYALGTSDRAVLLMVGSIGFFEPEFNRIFLADGNEAFFVTGPGHEAFGDDLHDRIVKHFPAERLHRPYGLEDARRALEASLTRFLGEGPPFPVLETIPDDCPYFDMRLPHGEVTARGPYGHPIRDFKPMDP